MSEEQNAYRARALPRYPRVTYEFAQIDLNFNDEVGFIPRKGIGQTKVSRAQNPRPGGRIRVMEPMINVICINDRTTARSRGATTRWSARFRRRVSHRLVEPLSDQIDELFRVQTVIIPKAPKIRRVELHVQQQPGGESTSSSPSCRPITATPRTSGTLGVRLTNRVSAAFAAAQRCSVAFAVNPSILGLDSRSRRARPAHAVRHNLDESNFHDIRAQLHRPGSDIYVVTQCRSI